MNTRIAEILIQNTLGISTYEPRMKNIIINLPEAEQALLAYFDEVIGNNEEIKGEGIDISDNGDFIDDTPHKLGRNQLRAELRRNLKGEVQ